MKSCRGVADASTGAMSRSPGESPPGVPSASNGLSHRHERMPRFGTKWQLLGHGSGAILALTESVEKPGFVGPEAANAAAARCAILALAVPPAISAYLDTQSRVCSAACRREKRPRWVIVEVDHLFRAVPRFQWLERLVLFDMRLACDGITWRRTPRPDHLRSRARIERVNDHDREISAEATLSPPASSGVGPRLSSPGEPTEFAATRTGSWFFAVITFSSSLALLVGFSVKNDRSHHRDDETSGGKGDDRTDRED